MRPWPFSTVVLATSSTSGASCEVIPTSALQRGLIALQREQKIGPVRDDLVGDFDLATHRVDGDQRAFESTGFGEVVEKLRDGGDFVGLLRHRAAVAKISRAFVA